jgi:NDP-sugar pyrophosphorylase family protein
MGKINVIIPMAGHSRRFSEAGYIGPKALLPVGNKNMIERVINMFDPTLCKYYIVINSEQLQDNSNLINELEGLASNIEIVVINSHEIGPVYSILQVKNIDKREEVIISYCDFFVEWDYDSFLRTAQGNDGCIVSFKGFHPASFGNTYYAYMRVKSGYMLELREKQSFTNDRFEEHASAGIYYFKNFKIFEKYAKNYFLKDEKVLPEAYVSLLYNEMVEDNLLVGIYEADKFICLGTPDDYEQYRFWHKYFTKKDKVHAEKNHNIKRIGLIPMAGKGSRFREYGYRVPKPLIKVEDIPMVIRVADSMPNQDKWIFLPRKEDMDRYPIERTLRKFSGDCVILPVNQHTSGQAATCLLAKEFIDSDSELIIASADYEHMYNNELWQLIVNDPTIDGAIWTYRSRSMVLKDPEKFAYCQVRRDGMTVDKVIEKKIISSTPHLDPLVIGTFWYRKAKYFIDAAENLIENDITINGEHYVGTSINYLIQQGKKFVIFDIDQWISFGDPFELKVLEYWREHFEYKQ